MLRVAIQTAIVSSKKAPMRPASLVQLAPQQRRGYHENIVEHYENPRNVGSLDKNDDNVGTVRRLKMCECVRYSCVMCD